jgi:nucleotide-binding universal stress UspA family protein
MRVLLAIDFSPVSDRTIKACAERSWPEGTVVRVMGVVEKIPPSAAELWYDAAGNLEEVWQARKERVEELALKTAEVLRSKGLRTETSVRTGRRRKEIALEAKSWSADFIIDASHGKSGLDDTSATPHNSYSEN